MSPQKLGTLTLRETPVLAGTDPIEVALRHMRDASLPALPVHDERDRLCGIFGEREFITALFPGYLGQLTGARFVSRSLDDDLKLRSGCAQEPVANHVNSEHIAVGQDFSDAELAETFLHHRVLIIPVVDERRRVVGVITRRDFFWALAERFLGG